MIFTWKMLQNSRQIKKSDYQTRNGKTKRVELELLQGLNLLIMNFWFLPWNSGVGVPEYTIDCPRTTCFWANVSGQFACNHKAIFKKSTKLDGPRTV
jgi:hypothetical protein